MLQIEELEVKVGERTILKNVNMEQRRKSIAVYRHPRPYLMLRNKFIDEASEKYFVGQLISATVCPNQIICAII